MIWPYFQAMMESKLRLMMLFRCQGGILIWFRCNKRRDRDLFKPIKRRFRKVQAFRGMYKSKVLATLWIGLDHSRNIIIVLRVRASRHNLIRPTNKAKLSKKALTINEMYLPLEKHHRLWTCLRGKNFGHPWQRLIGRTKALLLTPTVSYPIH